ncbi:MAG: class I SAM-dependent DNA methyltransferase [Actinomycetota bacterium]
MNDDAASALEPWSARSAELYEFIHDANRARADADRLHEMIREVNPDARSLLDVACGTGWHLERLRDWYAVEGVDASPAMLEIAGRRLGDVSLHLGDMRSFELGKRFDVVTCLSSSIAHMRTGEDLRRAVRTMARHLTEGGLLVLEPWDFPEASRDERPWVHTVEWDDRSVILMETTTLDGQLWRQDTHLLLWRHGGPIEHLLERTTLGAFTKDDHVRALEEAGLSVRFDESGLLGRGLFLGRTPSAKSD